MNRYDFINSRDIAKYLKETGYRFSTLESAWLVWQSYKHTLEQKHAAWQQIMDTMPDCSVEARQTHEKVRSLHDYLREHMAFEQQAVKGFFDLAPQMFYNGCAHTDKGDAWDPTTHLSVEACINHYRAEYADAWGKMKEEPIGFDIDKFQIGEPLPDMTLRIDGQGEVLAIKVKDKASLFESLWFDFPTPFEKGDMVVQAKNGYRWLYPGGLCTQFVLESICTGQKGSIASFKRNETYTDMLAYGYRRYTGYDKMYSYMDLEYADPSANGLDKALIPISLFLKGQIDVVEMAEAYRSLSKEDLYED